MFSKSTMKIAAAAAALMAVLASAQESCWVEAYGRGVGKPPSACPPGMEKRGALCYEECDEGYHGVGP